MSTSSVTWACPMCTLQNPMNLLRCDACQTVRGSSRRHTSVNRIRLEEEQQAVMARLLSVDTETVKKKPPKKRPSVSSSASTAKKSTSSSKKSSISALVKDDGHKSSITRQSSKRTEQQSESQASQASKRSKSQQPSKKFFSNVALSPSTACQSSVQQESSEKHCVSLNKLRQTEIRLDLDSETKHCFDAFLTFHVVTNHVNLFNPTFGVVDPSIYTSED
eukprot:gene6480-9354_t